MGLEFDGSKYTMKEMVGGCCVCSDEHGWPDNPLVYCDGTGCTVAVHQACYGIITVPIGPWYCRKCESPDRQAKVRCELCPSRSGALKRVDTGGWAHVVCALYIPEVRFGNVTSMEPIILQLIPPERYNKICYICQDLGRLNRASVGACMQCNKFGCKHQFHVTCAQGLGLLCEEAGNYLDNVKYCGYCQHHYSKLKKGGNVKTIPPYKPVSQDSHSSDSSPEKEGESVASIPSTSGSSSVIATQAVSASTSSAPKSVSAKSTSGRKSSSQQPSPILTKSSSNAKTSTPVTSTVSSPASNTTSSVSKIQNEAVASTSKSGSSSGQEKSIAKKWNISPSSTQQTAPENILNSLEFPTSSESSGSRSVLPSKYKLSKGGFSKSGSVSKSTVVIANTNISTPTNAGSVISTSAGSHTATEQSATVVKEKIETDMYGMTAEIKQTKKKKAASQSAAQDLSLYPSDSNITSSASGFRERAAFGTSERTPDSTNEEKIKRMKTEASSAPKSSSQSQNYAMGGLNIQMEQNLSTLHSGHAIPSGGHNMAQSGLSGSNLQVQNQIYSVDRPGPSHTITSGSQMMRNEAVISPRTLASASHIQGIPNKYTSADMNQSDVPSSLVVSVPLLQSAQGLNLSSQNNTIDLVNPQPPSPQPSSSGWGLKMGYEPQQKQPSSSMSESDIIYPIPKRARMDSMDVKMVPKPQGAILIDSIDKMASIASGGVRNKKRSASAMMQTLTQPNTLANINLSSHMPNIPNKRLQVTPPPSTSTLYHDSPPISPGSESRSKMTKPNIPRIGRAPHMLGNELNPDSPAVARLSEHLNAELVAHSVFRAPSPLVQPPLINRATGGRTAQIGGAVGLNVGAQSLDQLLERQWEQGSQFLMDQAQHFDIASLLSCLHQLRSENVNLEDHVGALTERRDHLLAVNARLAIPLNAVPNPGPTESIKPQRDTPNSMIRQPPPPQPRHDIMTPGTHQSMVRDIQPKPS